MISSLENRLPTNGSGLPPVNRHQLFAIMFLIVFVLLVAQLVVILRPFFPPILWAAILATATYPLYLRLWKGVGRRSNVSAGLMTGGVLVAAVLPALYGIVLAGQQGLEAYELVAARLKAGHLQDLAVMVERIPGVGYIGQELARQGIDIGGSTKIQESLLEGGKAVSTFVLSQSMDLATNALLLATNFLVMLFTLFFMFRDGDDGFRSLVRALPLEDRHKIKIFDRLNTTLQAVVRGKLLTALAQGTVAGVTYYMLGLPFATFLGVLSGILSFLPVGGTSLVWVPLALYLLGSGAMLKGVILIAVGVGVIGMMDNLLLPMLVGSEARLPVLPLFFSSLGGLAYFGFLGLFLGPILLAVVLETFDIYQEDYQQSKSDLILPALSGRPSDGEGEVAGHDDPVGMVEVVNSPNTR